MDIFINFTTDSESSQDEDDENTLAPMYEKNVKNLSFFLMSGDHDRKRQWQLRMMDEGKKVRSQERV